LKSVTQWVNDAFQTTVRISFTRCSMRQTDMVLAIAQSPRRIVTGLSHACFCVWRGR
jgi:hypothetical protein